MARIIVALPAYNEEGCLPPLLDQFKELFDSLPSEHDPIVIVVNDGSKDGTARVTEEAAAKLPVKLINHEKNKGLGEAIKTGLRAAMEESTSDEDMIICMDADNTHPPCHVREMIEALNQGADLVIASRYRKGSKQHGVPLRRQLLSLGALVVFKILLPLPGVRDYTCGFRAYRAGIIRKAFDVYGDGIITRNGFACTDQLLVHIAAMGGVTMREVPFILRYDLKEGESKLDLGTTISETFRLLFEGRAKLKGKK